MPNPPSSSTTETKYINGSDIVLAVGDKVMLGAKTHKRQIKTTTAVVTDKDVEDSLYERKVVKKVDITITCDGFCKTGDTSIEEIEAAITQGKTVKLKYGYKQDKNGGKSFTEGDFIVSSFDQTDPASDNSTYSATFVNDGKPTKVTAKE
ncbi:phage tail tube protein [uncultured Porphyromonas sp.]|uniref:phage tail tube protein n=1 Tax=uncultured Porphyromonas sp. TaxID=159274 RepID=UPI0026348562|nr:phage tail tube protein [uncultured Porphyromonas sp.]